MPVPFSIQVMIEIVAEVENLKTLRREFLIMAIYPWGETFFIIEEPA